MTMLRLCLFLICALLSWTTQAMRDGYRAQLRQETVDIFHHGFSNYMAHAFPEDELRPLSCLPLSRDRNDPTRIGLNDALGNYSLTLIDSLSTLAILAGGPDEGTYTGPKALQDFQDGVAQFVLYYGDGRPGDSGAGIRARGFDLDSKVQVFETVIRGVGGLLSAHLFAIGELPIHGYDPAPMGGFASDDPLELAPIPWPNGFQYDGQLLRLAFDLSQRLLPAFYTETGLPYPRVNLRHGIPFYKNSPLHQFPEDLRSDGNPEITETCSAGAGSLTLEFTVLSRLSGDPRFEQAAKRAFWEVWHRRSDIGLIGNGLDAERGLWIGPHSGIGAGMDSFFEYALKSHILLSGHGMPNASTPRRRTTAEWLDPDSLHPPLPPQMQSSDAFLDAWHQAHASVKRYLYNDRSHYPYYSNIHRATGQPYTMWIDSLGAFYPGLLALAGEVEEAIEANLVYTALWTRYSALPERWSISHNTVEGGLGWWPGRPEFVESTYHIYRATKDPWYLHVGEMVLRDIRARCYTPCGWAGLQDVRTGELQDRMESFFLGETTKYMYLLFDENHALNKMDAAYVFTTEGHPLILPKKSYSKQVPRTKADKKDLILDSHSEEAFTNTCPVPVATDPFSGSATAARPDLFAVSRFTNLHNSPNYHGPVETIEVEDDKGGRVTKYKAHSNHTIFPWTLPRSMLPENGTCSVPEERVVAWIEFPTGDGPGSLLSRLGSPLAWLNGRGPTIKNVEGLKMQLERRQSAKDPGQNVWRITQIGNTVLGKHEEVFFHAEHVRHLRDDAFSVFRRADTVDIVALVTTPDEDIQEASHHETAKDETVVELVVDGQTDAEDGLLSSLLRAMSSVLEPIYTDTSTSDSLDGPITVTWDAQTAVGPGAFPVPSIIDTPIVGSPVFNNKDPLANFPWRSIYMAGQACDGPLPDSAPREHQVIIMQRGGCSFSEKADNVPSFLPGRTSLHIVIVVDEHSDADGEDGEDAEAERIRPLLETEQLTPKGMRRIHGVPLVLMNGIPGDYEMFRRASGAGMRRKYSIQSQGLKVENAVVL